MGTMLATSSSAMAILKMRALALVSEQPAQRHAEACPGQSRQHSGDGEHREHDRKSLHRVLRTQIQRDGAKRDDQPFGLTHWNAAACRKVSGRARRPPRLPALPAFATFHASHSI